MYELLENHHTADILVSSECGRSEFVRCEMRADRHIWRRFFFFFFTTRKCLPFAVVGALCHGDKTARSVAAQTSDVIFLEGASAASLPNRPERLRTLQHMTCVTELWYLAQSLGNSRMVSCLTTETARRFALPSLFPNRRKSSVKVVWDGEFSRINTLKHGCCRRDRGLLLNYRLNSWNLGHKTR